MLSLALKQRIETGKGSQFLSCESPKMKSPAFWGHEGGLFLMPIPGDSGAKGGGAAAPGMMAAQPCRLGPMPIAIGKWQEMVRGSAEPLPQTVKLAVQRFRQMTAQPGVIRRHVFRLLFPARNVHLEQLLEAVGGKIQAG